MPALEFIKPTAAFFVKLSLMFGKSPEARSSALIPLSVIKMTRLDSFLSTNSALPIVVVKQDKMRTNRIKLNFLSMRLVYQDSRLAATTATRLPLSGRYFFKAQLKYGDGQEG